MKSTISLKIKQTEVPAQALMYLKKQTGHSLSILQEKLRNNDFIITLSYYEFESFDQINQMRTYLIEQKIAVDLYVNNRIVDPEIFRNIEQTHREIEEECETLPD